jgi:MoxR-like ATPase
MGTIREIPPTQPVIDGQTIIEARRTVNSIYMDDKVKDYIVDIVCSTRHPNQYNIQGIEDMIQMGASPRATIALTLASKALAFINGRGYVTPQDVKSIGMDVLRHRVMITYEAEAEEKTTEDIIRSIFDQLPVP